MTPKTSLAITVAIGLSAALSIGPASAQTGAQTGKPQLYALHTAPSEGCPGLDWHITMEPDHKLIGFVAWDRMTHTARIDGTIAKDGDFSMQAKENGGSGRMATIKGTASGDYIKVEINGSGTKCDGQILTVPRAGGGQSGGGG